MILSMLAWRYVWNSCGCIHINQPHLVDRILMPGRALSDDLIKKAAFIASAPRTHFLCFLERRRKDIVQ
jgi:hypothetical protein